MSKSNERKPHQLKEIHLIVSTPDELGKLNEALATFFKNNKKRFSRINLLQDLTGENPCLKLTRTKGFPRDYKKPIVDEAHSILEKEYRLMLSGETVVYSFC